MKKSILLLISTVVLWGCNKEKVPYSQFSGIWEYENFYGYPFNNNYLPPGNGKIIVLSANGAFERRQHDSVMFKGKYFLRQQKDCYGDEKKIHFSTDEVYPYDAYINIDSTGKLTLSTPNCYTDGGCAFYIKIAGN